MARTDKSGRPTVRRFFSLLLLTTLCWWLWSFLWPSHHIWYNAQIITMDEQRPVATAVAWRRGVISAIGSDQGVLAEKRWYSTVRDLDGQVVTPGFVDAHSHFPASGINNVTVDLSSPPLGDVVGLRGLYTRLRVAVQSDPSSRDWLIGFNYDQASLREGLHPNRQALDQISSERPIYAYHSSGHMGVANSAALEQLGLSAEAYPDGLLQEHLAPSLGQLIGRFSWLDLMRSYRSAQREYLSAGVTTVNSGAASVALTVGLRIASALQLLPMRTVVNPLHVVDNNTDKDADKNSRTDSGNIKAYARLRNFNSNRFRVGATKLIVDGSPQGFTAFLTRDFVDPPAGSIKGTSTRGSPLLAFEMLVNSIRHYSGAGLQLALHGNGDAAIDMILDAIEVAGLDAADDHRTLVIHAQTARQDQVDRMAVLGVLPSFFVSHVYYWGDWHAARVVGDKRAQHLSPTGWARDNDLRFSLHSDAPVTPVNPLAILQFAAERKTASGRLLGTEHRLSVRQALRAVTIDAAWQHFLSDSIGSLAEGKFADLVVLSANPFEVENSALSDIEVLETVIDGKVEFDRHDH